MRGKNEIQVRMSTLMEMGQEYFDKRAASIQADFEVDGVDLDNSNITGKTVTFKVKERVVGVLEEREE